MIYLYAADSAILASNNEKLKPHGTMQEEFSKIKDWLLDIKLPLHMAKTEIARVQYDHSQI